MSGRDPFDDVTPIGERRRKEETRERAAAPPATPTESPPQTPGHDRERRFERTKHLTPEELLDMIATRAREANRRAGDPVAKEADRKHAATSFGIFVDKFLAVSARPVHLHNFVEAETLRQPMRELGLVIAEAKRATTRGAPGA